MPYPIVVFTRLNLKPNCQRNITSAAFHIGKCISLIRQTIRDKPNRLACWESAFYEIEKSLAEASEIYCG